MSVLDEQFVWPANDNWITKGKTQKVLGCNYVKHRPTIPIEETPKILEFLLHDTDEVWGLGVNTRFKFRGQFQVMTPQDGEAVEIPWAGCTAAEATDVIVAPNYLERLIEMYDIFHGNSVIKSSDEGRYIFAFLNAWKYNYMDKEQKKLLCPQSCSPGYGVPSKKGDAGWSYNGDSEWVKQYAPTIFVGPNKEVIFDHVPIDQPLFFQGTNYGEDAQKVLPLPIMLPLGFRIKFHEFPNSIFKIRAGVKKKYRFIFTDAYMVAEHLRLNTVFKRTILSSTQLNYPGVCRLMRPISIPNSTSEYVASLQKVFLPEGIMIFAIPNTVLNGRYTYQSNTSGNVFLPHNIAQVNFTFGGQSFFMKEPHIGQINDDTIESKLFFDYLKSPPFGMTIDPDKITLPNIINGSVATPYPHVFINLCNYGDKSRIIPYINDGSILEGQHTLELTITFNATLSVHDSTYIVYMYYTDNNLTYKNGKNGPFFTSPYIQIV